MPHGSAQGELLSWLQKLAIPEGKNTLKQEFCVDSRRFWGKPWTLPSLGAGLADSLSAARAGGSIHVDTSKTLGSWWNSQHSIYYCAGFRLWI